MLQINLEEDLTYLAKSGDIDSQKRLFDECKKASLPICLQQLKNISTLNLDYTDLRDLVTPAFLRALNSYRLNKLDFLNYFKFIYIQEIKSLIRKTIAYNSKNEQLSDDFFHKKEYLKEMYFDDDVSTKYSPYDIEIIRNLLTENRMKLTSREYQLIQLYLAGLNMREISEYLNKNYTETTRNIKRAIDKIKRYFNSYNKQ